MIDDVLSARNPEDLFGDLGSGAHERLRTRYIEIVGRIHHDRDDERCPEAFQNLQRLYVAARLTVRNGSYGQK